MKGFCRNIRLATSIKAELWAFKDRLSLCISLNLVAFEIEVDTKVVLGWITNDFNTNFHHASLIMDCRNLISQIPQVKTKHYYCEANECADAITRKGPSTSQDFTIFDSLPMDICLLLYYNNLGVYYERICPQTSIKRLVLKML